MAKRLSNESPISDILKEIISANKLQGGIDQIQVRDTWSQIMGNGVASYTERVELKNDKLYVWLRSSVLREELMHGRSKIASMLNEALGREIISEVILR